MFRGSLDVCITNLISYCMFPGVIICVVYQEGKLRLSFCTIPCVIEYSKGVHTWPTFSVLFPPGFWLQSSQKDDEKQNRWQENKNWLVVSFPAGSIASEFEQKWYTDLFYLSWPEWVRRMSLEFGQDDLSLIMTCCIFPGQNESVGCRRSLDKMT